MLSSDWSSYSSESCFFRPGRGSLPASSEFLRPGLKIHSSFSPARIRGGRDRNVNEASRPASRASSTVAPVGGNPSIVVRDGLALPIGIAGRRWHQDPQLCHDPTRLASVNVDREQVNHHVLAGPALPPPPYALDAASEVNGRRDGLLGLVATARLPSMSDDMGAAAKGSGRLGSVDTGCFVRDHLRRRALGQAIPTPNQDR